MTSTCYMCDRPGTTTEHSPPQCLFPEDKDLPPGQHLRNKLITVPSCAEHNTKKSCDDEFLLYTLVINLPANGTAFQQFSTKILRAIKRNPSLIKRLFSSVHPVILKSHETGRTENSLAYNIDGKRFSGALEKVARGIYFNHFKRQWKFNVDVQPEFLISIDQPTSIMTNELTRVISIASDKLFEGQPSYGANPSVFRYQVQEIPEQNQVIMRLCFYGGGYVTVLFNQRISQQGVPPYVAQGAPSGER